MKKLGEIFGLVVYVDEVGDTYLGFPDAKKPEKHPFIYKSHGETIDEFAVQYKELMVDPRERVIAAAKALCKKADITGINKGDLADLLDAVDLLREANGR